MASGLQAENKMARNLLVNQEECLSERQLVRAVQRNRSIPDSVLARHFGRPAVTNSRLSQLPGG